MKLEFSKDQQKALGVMTDWYKTDSKKPFMTLGGYAGTGKTTLIAEYRKRLYKENKGLSVAFCSYTGKASRVLKITLTNLKAIYPKDSVSTIHSLIYSPIENEKGVITGWKRKDSINSDLIISDEASMIDEEIWRDLVSFDVPILAVGDHGQLPPIKSSFNLMQKPQVVLEEIHRQALDNPIIKVASYARRYGHVPVREFSNTVVKYSKNDPWVQDTLTDLLNSYDGNTLVLTGFNATRVKLNKYIRNSLEFYSPTPLIGDRVICLKNNHEMEIYNGMLGSIRKLHSYDDKWYEVEILMEGEMLYKGLVAKDQFGNPQSLNFTDVRARYLEGDLFDFGYALTVHKAQGSEAKRVVLFEERSSHMDNDTWRRWLYTAVTRAKEELYIFG